MISWSGVGLFFCMLTKKSLLYVPVFSAVHQAQGTLSRPLKHYEMEKITLWFNLSTMEQSNYRAKQSPGRPNKEKSKKIW